ncbi:PilN domain-containing protein [Sanguibacter massiliensis]|uniref:PilN domain-containing protein n=1 Tax=Sanguibacter massiliensis TaxID=1973217 RepID=UPI000C829118|nr:PilN domain-containing protein [Sanguibacter massiliensis]
MSLSLQKKAASQTTGSTRRSSGSLIPSVPRVNLLPAEIIDRRSLRSLRRMLLFVLLGVIVLCAGLGFFSWSNLVRAEADLEAEQQRTSDLLLEQRKYVEVTAVKSRIELTRDALDYVSQTEVDWDSVLGMVASATPEEVLLGSITVEAATPLTGAPAAADPLAAPSIGTMTLTGSSDTRPDISAWTSALEGLPGVVDARIVVTSAVREEDEAPSSFNFEVTVALSDVLQRADGLVANLPAESEGK